MDTKPKLNRQRTNGGIQMEDREDALRDIKLPLTKKEKVFFMCRSGPT